MSKAGMSEQGRSLGSIGDGRKGRLQQVFCCRARDGTGILDLKESGDSDSLG